MATPKFVKPELIAIRDHSDLDEKWIQERIAEDPSILGLGDLLLRSVEYVQPHAGRLDLLLEDRDQQRRYEVELQLGDTDPSHIIRTVEYWDIERKRYPQYEHCAVIVAENITSRFLNVISLFNGAIPLIAIQIKALKLGDGVGLIFTTVLNEIKRGPDSDDEPSPIAASRDYWESQSSKGTMVIADQVMDIIRSLSANAEWRYKKAYVGINEDGRVSNYAWCYPLKARLNLYIALDQVPETTRKLEDAGLDLMSYDITNGAYRIRLTQQDVHGHRDLLRDLLRAARDRFFS